jgi:hypothetical protein
VEEEGTVESDELPPRQETSGSPSWAASRALASTFQFRLRCDLASNHVLTFFGPF